jgi:hypothetical protein
LIGEVRLHGSIPLDDDGDVIGATSTGYQDGRVLDENAELATPVDVWLADASLSWQFRDDLQLGVRYQYIHQTAAAAPPLPLTFNRHLAMFSLRWFYPPPSDFLRRGQVPLRVDSADAPGAGSMEERRDR